MVEPVGFGAMCLSHAYGIPPVAADARRVLHHALDCGVDFIDTAALYGFGANEALIGAALAGRRSQYVLASKCGMTGVGGKRVIDGRPETLRTTVDESLSRLCTDHIDLYYLHRLDRAVPIEESVGAMARMVEAGKIGTIGLSEVSAATLDRAQAVHPIAALQTEYSPWSRDAEIAVLAKTREIGAAFVAFSPLARGFLADAVHDRAALPQGDIRRGMPRFAADNLPRNVALLRSFRAIAAQLSATPAQLAIAWGLAKAPHLVSIPGTTRTDHLDDNFAARYIALDPDTVAAIDRAINCNTVSGARYAAETQGEIDTELAT